MLERLRTGEKFAVKDWKILVDALFSKQAPHVSFSVEDTSDLVKLKADQIGFWTILYYLKDDYPTASSWCINFWRPSEKSVQIYSCRSVRYDITTLSHIAKAESLECYQLSPTYHRVSSPSDREIVINQYITGNSCRH
jgi:hypothetical protein